MIQVTLRIEGMKCEMCESHVCDQLRKVPGVKKAKASHRKNEAVAIAEENADTAMMKANIEGQGYEVGEVSIKPYEKKPLFSFLKRK